ncbi:MAG: response regulator [Gammaproteobacteria bacterium]|nr:response regulator [Gammaproteobacteria bacterium]
MLQELAGKTLLIIDDEPNNLQVAAEFLENQGVETMMAKDGEDGIDKARRGSPDLILLDIMMPGIDGYETCHRLKSDELTREIPVIFLTGLSELEHKLKAFAVGGVDYLTKPIQEPELLARVGIQLKLRQAQLLLAERGDKLEGALDTGNVVNVAIGIMMERHRMNRDDSFNEIRNRARSQRRKIQEIAQEIIQIGEMLNLWVVEKSSKNTKG